MGCGGCGGATISGAETFARAALRRLGTRSLVQTAGGSVEVALRVGKIERRRILRNGFASTWNTASMLCLIDVQNSPTTT